MRARDGDDGNRRVWTGSGEAAYYAACSWRSTWRLNAMQKDLVANEEEAQAASSRLAKSALDRVLELSSKRGPPGIDQ